MQGSKEKLVNFMESRSRRFLIPVYQREYSWSEENCRQLYNDLKKLVGDKNRKSHFFGSIVYSGSDIAGKTECQIIDGQQRITTVTILLLAMHNMLDKGRIHSDNARLSDEIYTTYLVDDYANSLKEKIKLRPVKEDRDALERLFRADEEKFVRESRITCNYNYFCDVLKKNEISVEELYEAIKKLEVILITLETGDDAQLIFESLNSTGMALSEGDKIRNYVLMGQSAERQELYYTDYWTKIEELTNKDVSGFAKNYLSVKQQVTPNERNIYHDFKVFVENQAVSMEDVLKDMLKYAKHYNKLLKCESGLNNSELDASLRRLKRLDFSVTRPFLITVLELCSEGEIGADDVLNILLITESYLFRRYICNVPTNALNKIFLNLDKEVRRQDGTTDDYVDRLVYVLETKRGSGRFPDDVEFKENLSTKQIYLMKGTFKDYLFERFESKKGIGEIDVYSKLDSEDYSIEHVMPQQLTPEWKEELGSEYEDIHNKWLHRLANLTLTVKNSSLSNKTFNEKLNHPKAGYIHSGLWMNKWIADQTSWGLPELEKRDEMLCDDALNIWAYPKSDFKPADPDNESCTLDDDDIDLTGRSIVRFSFLNEERRESRWIDMFVDVVKILSQSDSAILIGIASHTGDDDSLEKYFSLNPDDLRKPLQIDIDGKIFIESNTSTSQKISILRNLFAKYDRDPGDLVFYLQDTGVRLRDISLVLRKWAKGKEGVEEDLSHSQTEFIRFLTPGIKTVFTESEDGLSDWKTSNHYFYEIVNTDGEEIYIKLEVNSKNASQEFKDNCNMLRGICSGERVKSNWRWCMLFRTRPFCIGEDISEAHLVSGLDECLEEIIGFEHDLKEKLRSMT